MCGFSWQLQLHPLQPPSAHMVRSEQGALTQPARGLTGAAMRAVLDPSAALWQPMQGTRTWAGTQELSQHQVGLSVASNELVLSKVGLTRLLLPPS